MDNQFAFNFSSVGCCFEKSHFETQRVRSRESQLLMMRNEVVHSGFEAILAVSICGKGLQSCPEVGPDCIQPGGLGDGRSNRETSLPSAHPRQNLGQGQEEHWGTRNRASLCCSGRESGAVTSPPNSWKIPACCSLSRMWPYGLGKQKLQKCYEEFKKIPS